MVDALSIGYAIKNRRAELRITQEQLAQASGVSKRCIWSLEMGMNPGVQLNKLMAVLDVLGLELNIAVTHVEYGAENIDGAARSPFEDVPRKAQSQEPPEIPAGVLEAISVLTESKSRGEGAEGFATMRDLAERHGSKSEGQAGDPSVALMSDDEIKGLIASRYK